MAATAPQTRPKKNAPSTHRDRLLAHLGVLGIPLSGEDLDQFLAEAEREHLGPLEFVDRLLGRQADARRERTIQRRIRDACFREVQALEAFDWEFNRQTIDRRQIEDLATGDFIRRCDNLVLVGQSGVGKSFLMQALGRRACALGYRVRYITSADLLQDLCARLADKSLPQRVRYYARFDWLIIDEFGFDRLERLDSRPATNLLYKIIDARTQRSTSLVTNVDFERWAEYLDDPPLAMAFLDRVVDGAIILKIQGKSYRAHRAQKRGSTTPDKSR
jgi:DNA replication protein DnaC